MFRNIRHIRSFLKLHVTTVCVRNKNKNTQNISTELHAIIQVKCLDYVTSYPTVKDFSVELKVNTFSP